MRIIGLVSRDYNREYICTVSHAELEKFLGTYYARDPEKLRELKTGDVIDLARGFDHAGQITIALSKTQEFIKANADIVKAILNGLSIERDAKAASKEVTP